jgi:glycerol-3-phosphate O-acyltransferase
MDPVRDAQYTRELSDEICKAYLTNTVVMSTHIVAAACFERLKRATHVPDLFMVLRQRDAIVVPRDDLSGDVVRLRDQLIELEKRGKIMLTDFLRRSSGGEIVELALAAFAGYHAQPVLASRPDGIAIVDPNLLFYYQNRLAAHGMAWDVIAPPGMAPAKPPTFDNGNAGGAS